MRLEHLLDFLIDANILVLVAAFAFLSVELCLATFGYKKSYSTRLWLLVGSLGFAAVLPLIAPLIATAQLAALPNASEILISQYLKGNISISAVNFDNLLSARTTILQAVHSGSNPWITLGAAALGFAILVRFGYLLVSMLQITRLIRNGYTVKNAKHVKIVVSPAIDVPFSTRGLLKYYVVIPQSLLTDRKTLMIALGHEFQHIRQCDVTVEFLLAAVSPLFVANPGFWFLSKRLRKLREHTCDIAFLRRSTFGAKDYAHALLKVAKQVKRTTLARRLDIFSVPFIGPRRAFVKSTKSALAERLLAFAELDLRTPSKLFSAMLLAAASGLIVLGSSALQPSSGWSHDRIMISSVANLERLNQRNSANSGAAGLQNSY